MLVVIFSIIFRAGSDLCFFFSSRRRHTRWPRDWSSDVCSSDLGREVAIGDGILQKGAGGVFGAGGPGAGAAAGEIEAERRPGGERVAEAKADRAALGAVPFVGIDGGGASHTIEQANAE